MPQTTIADVYAKSVSELLRQKEKLFVELFQQQPGPYAPFERKDVKMSKGVIVRMLSPDKKYFQEFSSLDAPALASEGWTAMTALACDACDGAGTIAGEVCWHCEGGRFDPLKYDYERLEE